jgi:iron complex transport system substrate-binding protein
MRRIVSTTVLVALVALVPLGTTTAASAKTSRPTRIVSLSPTATEMLFAIGAGKQVVAVDDQSNFPKGAPKTNLSGFEPNAEAVAGYNPDLVVLPDTKIAAALESLNIKVLVLQAAAKLGDSYAQLRALGRATGHRDSAARVITSMKSGIEKLVADVPHRKPPTAYYELDETFFSADSSTFIGRLLKLAGLDNIADKAPGGGSGYPQLSAEFVIHADPAVIFLADTKCCAQTTKTVAGRPGFSDLRAVKNHHVVLLDDDIASRWGPRVVQLLAQIVKATRRL